MGDTKIEFGDATVLVQECGRVLRVFELFEKTESAPVVLGMLIPKKQGDGSTSWSAFYGTAPFLNQLEAAVEINLLKDVRLGALALLVMKYKYKAKVPFALSRDVGGSWEIRNGEVVDKNTKCKVW